MDRRRLFFTSLLQPMIPYLIHFDASALGQPIHELVDSRLELCIDGLLLLRASRTRFAAKVRVGCEKHSVARLHDCLVVILRLRSGQEAQSRQLLHRNGIDIALGV